MYRCIKGCRTYSLQESVYACDECNSLLEVVHDAPTAGRDAEQWKQLFASRRSGTPGPHGSGVWRYQEWVHPTLPPEHIVTLGEGNTPLVDAKRLSDTLKARVLMKQCGHSLSGSFKDLGMTVLVSQVHHMRQSGIDIPAVACASTGDTSAALAAYGAAAGVRTLVLLPRGKISAAQLVQPLAHGARVIAIDTDFDGCMEHVQRLTSEEGVYLANSKNSLRIEGQKTVAFEIVQGLGWQAPDWVAIPGGNLGNVSALASGFKMLQDAGIISAMPRVIVGQAASADPLYRSFKNGLTSLEPVQAQATQANAIRIGNPVSFPKAVKALELMQGVVCSVSEHDLTAVARDADESGLYVCPHTAVALAAVNQQKHAGLIADGDTVAVVATAHGLKFTEFKRAMVSDTVPGAKLHGARQPLEVPDDYSAVVDAALGSQ